MPVTRSVKLPVVAVEAALTETGEVDNPPDGGAMGEVIVNVTPAGAVPTQEGVSDTGELKALSDPTVIVAEPLLP